MKKHKRMSNKIKWIITIFYLIFFGIAVVIVLGILGQWMSLSSWIYGGLSTILLLIWSYSMMSRRAFKIIGVSVLVGFLLIAPLYILSSMVTFQGIAESLTASKEINYFKNVLGRSYNYTDLILWENEHLNFSNGNIQRNTDPIAIYEYGKGRCEEFAILYAELCISQGYQCRIVLNVFGDHVWNEVEIDGNWVRVDASPTGGSLSENISYHVGFPLFYEEVWHSPPVLALAFEGSSVVDVTGNYRSDHWSLLSVSTFLFVFIAAWFAACIFIILERFGKTVPIRFRSILHQIHLRIPQASRLFFCSIAGC
jgi:hypothetical protein